MSKKKNRRKLVQDLIFSIENQKLFVSFFNIYSSINKSWKIKLRSKAQYFQAVDFDGNELTILHKGRIPFYKGGIHSRVSNLLSDYLIDLSMIEEDDIFIDCGANIGELGVGLRLSGKRVQYVAFEPGIDEYNVCILNNPGTYCINQALWNSVCSLKFFEKSDSADSSLIDFGGHNKVSIVSAITLDEYCRTHNISRIKYLKIEAEGAEPEALEGATKILKRTRFVTVDCGFERGHSQESTLPQVQKLLKSCGFKQKKVTEGRVIALFENTFYEDIAEPLAK